jgi:hypothetical protein
MWIPFRIDGRDMEWHLSEGPTRYFHVRSRCGGYHVQSTILDDVFARTNGRISASVVGAPLVIGPEFPLGSRIPCPQFQMEGASSWPATASSIRSCYVTRRSVGFQATVQEAAG